MRSGNVLHCLYQARDPASAAFVLPGQKPISTGEWRETVARLAAALHALGVGHASRVSFRLPKCPEVVALAHACFQLGAVIQPINSSYTDVETRYMVDDADPCLVVCHDSEFSRMSALVQHRDCRVETLGPGLSGSLGVLARASAPHADIAGVTGDAVAAILYTSGTTGKPKGAQITHGNLARSARALREVWRLTPADTLVHFLPVYHAHGLLTSINVLLAAGGSVVFLERFEPAEVLTALGAATILMGVPTHYARLLREPHLAQSLSRSFRLAISGSAPLPLELAERFAERTGHCIIERYGSTEAAIVTAIPSGCNDRAGWVGWALPEIEIRVLRKDGTRAHRAASGILETRGHNVFIGYWRRPEADGTAFTADGWFITGDLAEIDDTGCVRLLGRSHDLIISGGLNIYPREVETAIDELPGVVESAVFGVPHPDFGEAGVAAVCLAPGATLDEKQAIEILRTRLAGYKVPKRLLHLQELPCNSMGKVLKSKLRDSYRTLFTAAATQ